MEKLPLFHCTSPCSNCPYRKDAKLKHWYKEEFEKLLQKESDLIGSIYKCHKQNGSVCVGWLMKQDENNFPSIALRMQLSANNVTREYLDQLNSPAPLFKDVKAMIKANFPQLLKTKK